jgi:hypothetical protein
LSKYGVMRGSDRKPEAGAGGVPIRESDPKVEAVGGGVPWTYLGTSSVEYDG